MKRLFTLVTLFCVAMGFAVAQVPSQSEDVMLQAFYWNSHGETKWTQLTSQADEIGSTFTLVWLPPASSAEFGGSSNMGYHPYQWSNLSSSWGNKAGLTALIQALKAKNCRAIADIVINHHAGSNDCCSFPTENFGTYGSYQFDATCVPRNDESGKGQGGNDAGYGDNPSGSYSACRDLDHSNSKVQNACKAYLQWMKNEIGYDGWRYDLVKGYLGKYNKMYNAAAGAYMSVGEYYDSSYDGLLNWVKETGYTSMVFDFAFHDQMVKWGGGSDYSQLAWLDGSTPRPAGLCHSPASRKYAVTFIDNHDTDEKHTDGNWPYRGDWEKANAVMLAAPGIPCVFWRHWSACKSNIKKMIAARKAVGIHSESDVVVNNTNGYYEATATGHRGKLKCFVGGGWSAPSGYTLACQGTGWAYYTTAEGGQQGGGSQGGGEQGGGSVAGSSFYIRINGSTDYAASPVGETDMQGREQYMASAYVKAGQTVSMFDKDNNAEWTICSLDPYGSYQNFTMSGSGSSCKMTCNVDGCYDFYIKLKFEDDMIYVGPGTNCSSQGEQGGSSQGGGEQGGGTQGGGTTPTTGFSILVNGTNYPASSVGEPDMQGREQYMASAYVKAGQTVSCYDNENKAEWTICNLDPYGSYQNFTMSGSGASCKMTCNVDGCYDFYIKLKFEDDMIYVGPGTNCSSQGGGEQGGGEQGGGSQGGGEQGGGSTGGDCGSSDHLWYVKGYINGDDVNGIEGDNVFEGGIANYNFTGEKNYVFVIYQVHGVAGVQYMATAGNVVEGVTHATLSPSGSGKFVIPAGVNKVYLYDNGNNTVEISTQPISGKTLIDACEGGEQGGGSQGGGEQGGGEQGGGEQGGSTTKSITVKVDPANIPWTGGVSVHAWETGGGNLTGEWPGTAMTQDANGWWTYTFNLAGQLNVIFNNGLATGTIQTNNIEEIDANACYKILSETITDVWGNSVYEFESVECLGGGEVNAADEAKAAATTIYPNPVDEVLNIESQTEFDSAVVTNLAGQTMFFSVSDNKIAVGSLSKGLYIIDLVREDGSVEKAKFIKK